MSPAKNGAIAPPREALDSGEAEAAMATVVVVLTGAIPVLLTVEEWAEGTATGSSSVRFRNLTKDTIMVVISKLLL